MGESDISIILQNQPNLATPDDESEEEEPKQKVISPPKKRNSLGVVAPPVPSSEKKPQHLLEKVHSSKSLKQDDSNEDLEKGQSFLEEHSFVKSDDSTVGESSFIQESTPPQKKLSKKKK